MTSATDGWIVGDGGVILLWNGTSWSSVTSPVSSILYDVVITATNPGDGWIVGAQGKMLRFVPRGTFLSGVLDTDAGNANWDTLYFSVTTPASTTATCVPEAQVTVGGTK